MRQALEGMYRRIRLDWRGGVNVYLYANGNPKRYIDDTAKLFLDLTTFVSAQREVTLGEAVERGKLTRTVTLPMLMLALSSPVIVTATSTVKTTGASGIYVCKKAAEWYMRGAENDIYWQNLSWKDKLYYEIGQKTTRDYIRYSSMGIVARGRAIVKDKGWITALTPETGGLSLGLGVGTFRTGPTPAGRWFMSRTAAGITAFTVIGSIPSDSSSCFCEEK